jgi:hypothetical protein
MVFHVRVPHSEVSKQKRGHKMRTNSQQEAGALPENEFKVDSFIS